MFFCFEITILIYPRESKIVNSVTQIHSYTDTNILCKGITTGCYYMSIKYIEDRKLILAAAYKAGFICLNI